MKKAEKEQVKNKKKHRLFYIFIAAIVFPVVFVLVIELGLRVFGFGYNINVVKRCTIGQEKLLCNNDDFSWRFFNREIAREFIPFVFSQTKPKGTYRIFIFGSSAAKGEPDSAYCFGRVLEIMLESKYRTVDFEIINTALTAINSHVVLKAVEECANYEPDAFVVYMGNNEVVGPYGAGTVGSTLLATRFSSISSNIRVIRASIYIRGTKVGQLLSGMFEKWLPEGDAQWGGMEMFTKRLVRSDDKGLQNVYRHFEKNLDDICRIADARKIPLVLCTVPTNIKDCPPFGSVHRLDFTEQQNGKWDKMYKQGIEKENQLLYAEAIRYYLDAETIDANFADLQFRLGWCMYELGQYDAARKRLTQAREYDALRFRADNRINKIIKSIAYEMIGHNIFFADALKVFEENSSYQIIGSEYFYEHVHLNFKGNFTLARTVLEQIEKILPGQIKKNESDAAITEEQCERLLAFTDWDRYRTEKAILDEYISKRPFTNQLYHDRQAGGLKNKIESLGNLLTEKSLKSCAEIYRKAIANRPDDWMLRFNFAMLLSDGLKDYKEAAEQMNFVVQKVPQNYQAAAQLGIFYSQLGEYEEGADYLKRALSVKENGGIYFNLAVVCQKQGKLEEAIKCYRQAVRLNKLHGKAWCNMTALLGEMKRFDEAIDLCRQGLKNLPEDKALNLGLATLLILDGHRDEAVQQLNYVLKIDPNQAQARTMLENLTGQ